MHRLVLSVSGLLLASTATAGEFDRFQYARVGSGSCTIPHGTEQVGAGLDAVVRIYLFPSGNYSASYEERTPSCANVSGECGQSPTLQIYREGRWSESGGQLSLSGFGTASVSGDDLKVSVTDSRISADAQGHVFTLDYRSTSVVAYTLARIMERSGYSSTIPEVRDAVY